MAQQSVLEIYENYSYLPLLPYPNYQIKFFNNNSICWAGVVKMILLESHGIQLLEAE